MGSEMCIRDSTHGLFSTFSSGVRSQVLGFLQFLQSDPGKYNLVIVIFTIIAKMSVIT